LCASDGSATQGALELDEGFWRISASSTDIFACPFSGSCKGGWGDSSSSRRFLLVDGDDYGDAYCAPGYLGPLCGVCDPNGYYFDSDEALCMSCESSWGLGVLTSPTVFVFLVFILIALVGSAVVFFYSRSTPLDLALAVDGAISNVEEAKKRVAATKKKANDALVKLMTPIKASASSMALNKDGSVTFISSEEFKLPPHVDENTATVSTAVASIVTMTTTTTKAVVKKEKRVTFRPSSYVLSKVANFRKIQNKLKVLTSFGQIR